MNKIISNNTVFPTRIVRQDFWAMPIIQDYMALKPKPAKDVLLILGDGFNLLQDVEKFYSVAEGVVPYDTMCVNYSALVCPHPYQHFAAGDAHLPDMKAVARRVPPGVIKHAWNPGCWEFDVRWIRNGRGGWSGTSTNLAFKIGLALDYTRIVLAGCPMDDSGNWYKPLIPDNDIKKNKDHRHHLWKWMEIATRPVGRFLRSMSGNTADLFGRPTREWLLHLPEEYPDKEN
ncbi:MAG: hypothetical protein ABIJ57_13360 [Pseudomonadota bacterium]